MVILEQPAQSLPDLNTPLALTPHTVDHHVSDALVTSLVMVMRNVFCDRVSKRFSPQEDHLIETLRLDRPHEPFCVRVHVRRLVRRKQNLDAGAA